MRTRRGNGGSKVEKTHRGRVSLTRVSRVSGAGTCTWGGVPLQRGAALSHLAEMGRHLAARDVDATTPPIIHCDCCRDPLRLWRQVLDVRLSYLPSSFYHVKKVHKAVAILTMRDLGICVQSPEMNHSCCWP